MAYLVLLGFQVIAFLNFWELVDTLSQRRQEYSSLRDPMSAYISGSPAFWIAIMVAIPLLTMRLMAEERRSGTIETLLTLPVTETEVVVAKWLAGLVMYWALLLPFAIYLPFLYYQARFYFDIGPVLTLALGLSTMGMMLVAFGVFFSSMTRNQLVAAIWTFVVIFILVAIAPLFYIFAVRQHAELGRRHPVRVVAVPDPELRSGRARFAHRGASSVGLSLGALSDGEVLAYRFRPLRRPADADYRGTDCQSVLQ